MLLYESLSKKMLHQLTPDEQPFRRYEHFNVRT